MSSEREDRQEEQQQPGQKTGDYPTSVYEPAKEEEEITIEHEQDEQEGIGQRPADTRKQRRERGAERDRGSKGGPVPERQVTLFGLNRQFDKQTRIIDRMAEDVRNLKKQLIQVQRDLTKLEKRSGKKTAITSTKASKRATAKRRGR